MKHLLNVSVLGSSRYRVARLKDLFELNGLKQMYVCLTGHYRQCVFELRDLFSFSLVSHAKRKDVYEGVIL